MADTARPRITRSASREPIPNAPPVSRTKKRNDNNVTKSTRSRSASAEVESRPVRRTTQRANATRPRETSSKSPSSNKDAESGTRKFLQTNKPKATDVELSTVQEDAQENDYSYETANDEDEAPRRRPAHGRTSNISGSTAISSTRTATPKLDIEEILNTLEELYEVSTTSLEQFATPDVETVNRLLVDVKKKNSKRKREFRTRRGDLETYCTAFLYENDRFINRQNVVDDIFGDTESDETQALAGAVYMANLAIAMVEALEIHQDPNGNNPHAFLRNLLVSFPSSILSSISSNSTNAHPGQSRLASQGIDLGIEICTQFILSSVQDSQGSQDDLSELVATTFNRPQECFRGWAAALVDERDKTRLFDKCRRQYNILSMRLKRGELQSLRDRHSWAFLISKLLSYAHVRQTEIGSAIDHLGGINELTERLEERVKDLPSRRESGESDGQELQQEKRSERHDSEVAQAARRLTRDGADPWQINTADPSQGSQAPQVDQIEVSGEAETIPVQEEPTAREEAPVQHEPNAQEVREEAPAQDIPYGENNEEMPIQYDDVPSPSPQAEDGVPAEGGTSGDQLAGEETYVAEGEILDETLPGEDSENAFQVQFEQRAVQSQPLPSRKTNLVSGLNGAANPRQADLRDLARIRATQRLNKENLRNTSQIVTSSDEQPRRRTYFDRQENAGRVEFNDGFSDHEEEAGQIRQRSPAKRKRRDFEGDDESSPSPTADGGFEQDTRVVDESRRQIAPPRKKARMHQSTSIRSTEPRSPERPLQEKAPPRPMAPAVGQSRENSFRSEPRQSRDASYLEESPRRRVEGPDSDYRHVKQLARQNAAAMRTDRRRKNMWSIAEENRLQELIRDYGCKWAYFASYEDDDGVPYFPERTNVDLKDKARNMKVDMIKSGTDLPANFNKVPIGSRVEEKLRQQGFRFN